MPGVVMDDASDGGAGPGLHHANGLPAVLAETDKIGDLKNDSIHVNGTSERSDGLAPKQEPSTLVAVPNALEAAPELAHITQGFFPFTKLIDRSVQQCWNDLSEIITELAEIHVSSQAQPPPPTPITGKSPGNQSEENVHRKLRILDFAHAKRAEFIKLLVLSQWSRQAASVSKLIDIQAFIRSRHQAYAGALQWLGDMGRDLVRAQVANPDLKTALEVLSKGGVVGMPDVSSC